MVSCLAFDIGSLYICILVPLALIASLGKSLECNCELAVQGICVSLGWFAAEHSRNSTESW